MMKMSLEQLLKILGLSFVFGTTVAALKADINSKADKTTVAAESTYVRQLNARLDGVKIDVDKEQARLTGDLDRTLTNINNRLGRMEDRLTEICKATRAGCR